MSDWTEARRRTLAAVVGHWLPADPAAPPGHGAGADEAGVAGAVVAELSHPFDPAMPPLVLAVLDELDERARKTRDGGFAALDAEEREAALRSLEVDHNPYLSHGLVALLQLALESFLGDPRRGGNRDGTGWRRVGLSGDGPRRSLRPIERRGAAEAE